MENLGQVVASAGVNIPLHDFECLSLNNSIIVRRIPTLFNMTLIPLPILGSGMGHEAEEKDFEPT
jgi:hypothetical protein